MENRKNNKEKLKIKFFNLVVAVAKTRNLPELKQLFADAGYNSLAQDSEFNDEIYDLLAEPVKFLAEKGAENAVDFLLEIRPNLKDEAIEGYALGKHVKLFYEMVHKSANINRGIFGAACKGLDSLVKDLLAKGGKVESAVSGYARGGYANHVNVLLTSHPEKVHLAVYGYACGGHFKLLEEQLKRDGADMYDAIRGFLNQNYLASRSRFLYLLTMLEHQVLRKELIRAASMRYPRNFIPTNMLRESDRLKQVMRLHELNYNQAISWMTLKFRIWLLQGVQLMQTQRLPLDMVLYIASFIPSCEPLTTKEMQDLRMKFTFHANKRFVTGSLTKYASGLFPGGNTRKKRAESLMNVCATVKSKHDLYTLIKYQKELFEKKKQLMPNRHRPAHEQPFENYVADIFTAIIDRYHLKLK